jgi:copper chaperone CopZ
MFAKGSRYRNLPQSSSLTSRGERIQGVDLRLIPARAGTFLHTIQDSDRLDLLAFKYYGDATKWWQISDTNAEVSFPTDLIDDAPLVEQRMEVAHPDSETRYVALLVELGLSGVVEGEKHDIIESTVIMSYDGQPATRQEILDAIKGRGFTFMRAFHWEGGPGFQEAFVFDDRMVKTGWHTLVGGLSELVGVIAVRSVVSEAAIDIVFNSAMVSSEAVANLIESAGFALLHQPAIFSRTGKQIVIPPNQIV